MQEGQYIGRTRFMAPDVDGLITIDAKKDLTPGTFVQVLVTGSTEYDLMGEAIDEHI